MIKVIGRYFGIMFLLFFSSNLIYAQEGFGTQQPDKSAAVDIESTKRGLLIPRVALTRTNLAAPVITPVAQSLLVYNENTTTGENSVNPGYYYWDTDRWVRFAMQDDVQEITLAGDVTGLTGDTKVVALQGVDINSTAPVANQILVFDGTEWVPTSGKNLSAGDASITVTDGAGATLVNTSLKVADGGIDSNHLANNAVNTDKIQGVGNNQVLITTSTGDVAWVDQNNLLASIASGNTTLVSGTGTTTDPYIVEIKDGSIDTIHLANGAVTAEKMSAATDGSNDGMVPVADAAGNVSYKKVAVENIESKNLTAWEGDPNDPNNPSAEEATIEVVEGGTDAVLVETSIKVKAESITSGHIKDKTIQPVDIANAGTDQVLVTDDAGAPTWKDADKVTPRFFYMPSVVFDTRQTGTGLTRDLYQDYVNQFQGVNPYDMAHGATGSSMSYDGGIISSDPTNRPTIAVFGKDDLVYYITYYDTDVFANLSIDSDGVLTYDIIGSAKPSSYMNIVFVIK